MVKLKKKMSPVNPKPAAKVDNAAKVLLAPKPPPPFLSGNDRPIEKTEPPHGAWVMLVAALFLASVAAIFVWLYLHAGY